MIPYQIDPSLHAHEPEPEELGDGFSPPQPLPGEPVETVIVQSEEALGDKSPF